ncbi:hypothetical protein, partial [Anaerosolibacter sp.]|uniref:hypothetical protein n=1 Tax=Anaerosolibacter sp. TaxID=1872527 RepID=UPI0039F05138
IEMIITISITVNPVFDGLYFTIITYFHIFINIVAPFYKISYAYMNILNIIGIIKRGIYFQTPLSMIRIIEF